MIEICTDENIINASSKTGDIETDDFNLKKDKFPALSTVRKQINDAQKIIKKSTTSTKTVQHDRLRIGLNLLLYGVCVEFDDLKMEDILEDPRKPPSYMEQKDQEWEKISKIVNSSDNQANMDHDDNLDYLEEEECYFNNKNEQAESEGKNSLFFDSKIKRRIRYDDYKDIIGLLNMFIYKGVFVVDITGKFMHDLGMLGSLHKDNIREALQKVLDLHVVSFDIEKFIQHAQVFCCDPCLDLKLDSNSQVERYINGISSFFPISTHRFKIAKYDKHGLTLKPKSDSLGFSLAIYSKGYELKYSRKRSTKAAKYANKIGIFGQKLAQCTLRLEIKLYKLNDIRKWLEISKQEKGVVSLVDVLSSTVPVMLNAFELFCGNAQMLLGHLDWLNTLETEPSDLTLKEIFLAERFIEILRENSFDINLARSHIKTEYANVRDIELENYNRLANIRRHILNYIVYRKPRSITIILSLLSMLQNYYYKGMVNANE